MRRVSSARKQIVGRRPACVLAVRGLGERPLEVRGRARRRATGPRARTRPLATFGAGPDPKRGARRDPRRPPRGVWPSATLARNPSAPPLKREPAKPSPEISVRRRHRSSLTAEQSGKTAVRKPGTFRSDATRWSRLPPRAARARSTRRSACPAARSCSRRACACVSCPRPRGPRALRARLMRLAKPTHSSARAHPPRPRARARRPRRRARTEPKKTPPRRMRRISIRISTRRVHSRRRGTLGPRP